jgi:hypothetical protein
VHYFLPRCFIGRADDISQRLLLNFPEVPSLQNKVELQQTKHGIQLKIEYLYYFLNFLKCHNLLKPNPVHLPINHLHQTLLLNPLVHGPPLHRPLNMPHQPEELRQIPLGKFLVLYLLELLVLTRDRLDARGEDERDHGLVH